MNNQSHISYFIYGEFKSVKWGGGNQFMYTEIKPEQSDSWFIEKWWLLYGDNLIVSFTLN